MTDAIILRPRGLGMTGVSGVIPFMSSDVKQVRNWRARDWPADDPDVVFRWGCTSRLLEGMTTPIIVNTPESIRWCSDKQSSRMEMQAAGVPVPESFSIEGHGNVAIPYPTLTERGWVGRPSRHSQGKNMFIGNTIDAVRQVQQWGGGYISRLIDKVAEYRVFVCQNRVVWVAQKTPGNPGQVAWNVAQGGRFDNVLWGSWNKAVNFASLKAAKVSGTDFCAVDVMVDAEGNPYVLEVNSAPAQESPYRNECVAKVFDHIIRNGKEPFPDFEDSPRRTWKSFIHPALRSSNGT